VFPRDMLFDLWCITEILPTCAEPVQTGCKAHGMWHMAASLWVAQKWIFNPGYR